MTDDDQVWVPDACTLPTVERPLRLAEFDEVFAMAVRGVDPLGPTRARMRLAGPAGLAARVLDLTARETECCSFFGFTVTAQPAVDGEALVLDIEVPPSHADVLASLVRRATAGTAGWAVTAATAASAGTAGTAETAGTAGTAGTAP